MDSHVDLFDKAAAASRRFWELDPLEVRDVPWIYVKSTNYPRNLTNYSGKWIIFTPKLELKKVWEVVKQAALEGKLGFGAKVATGQTEGAEKPICVYTYDWRDHVDVHRVREELRKLGVIVKIPYKTNYATMHGIYSDNSYQKISKYYE